MPTNLQEFNKELEKAKEYIHGDFEKFYKMVCLETFSRIVLRTPVDTGRARGNWLVEIGFPATGILTVQGSASEMATQATNRAVRKLSDIPPYSVVHITNNVEYISYLEYDKRSKQAPNGMVEITLSEMAHWLYAERIAARF